jgi:hypothetical protein
MANIQQKPPQLKGGFYRFSGVEPMECATL